MPIPEAPCLPCRRDSPRRHRRPLPLRFLRSMATTTMTTSISSPIPAKSTQLVSPSLLRLLLDGHGPVKAQPLRVWVVVPVLGPGDDIVCLRRVVRVGELHSDVRARARRGRGRRQDRGAVSEVHLYGDLVALAVRHGDVERQRAPHIVGAASGDTVSSFVSGLLLALTVTVAVVDTLCPGSPVLSSAYAVKVTFPVTEYSCVPT